MSLRLAMIVGASLLLALPAFAAEEQEPEALRGITVHDQRGAQLDLGLTFSDHDGKRVRLADFFDGKRPVLLTLNYYQCRMLCTEVLNGTVAALRGLEWSPGEQYRVVTVSIDGRETPELAAEKRRSYLEALDKGDVDWTFLVGDTETIAKLAETVGFTYRYDRQAMEWAHPAVIHFLSPDGRVMQYLFGVKYPVQSVKFALMEAGEGKVGSTFDKLIFSCFHYDALRGAYGPWAFGIMRLGGICTAVFLAGFVGILWRRDRARQRAHLAQTVELLA